MPVHDQNEKFLAYETRFPAIFTQVNGGPTYSIHLAFLKLKLFALTKPGKYNHKTSNIVSPEEEFNTLININIGKVLIPYPDKYKCWHSSYTIP